MPEEQTYEVTSEMVRWSELEQRYYPVDPEGNPLSHKPLSWIQRIRSYLAARRKWKLAKKPMRSWRRVKEIFDTHCAKCDHLVDGKRCGLCGCGVSSGAVHMNKLVFATEQCPDKPPRFLADVVPPS